MEEPARVLVTGASGYIASHLIKSLLTDGVYRVRGTVRSLQATDKIQPIKELEPRDAKYPLELVEASLTEKESWVEAVRGCTYVYHLASTFPGSGSDLTPEQQQERIIKPAVEDTLTVLQACADVGGLKRVVVTGSMASISCGMRGDPKKPKEYLYSEEDWSDESACTPYDVSKKKAEEAAWDFVGKLEDDKKFELAVVNPCYVQGPLLSAASGVVSQVVCSSLLSGKIPALPDINMVLVDVRDVVAVHRAAMERPEAAGKRYLAAAETISFKEIAAIVKEEFQDQGYGVSLISMPKFAMWIMKFFDQTAKEMYSMWGRRVLFNNERMQSLGVQPRPIRETIIEMCYSLIELGLVVKKPHYRGVPKAAGGAEGEDIPAQSSEKPVESAVDKPAESSDKPGESAEAKPAESSEKRGESAVDKPAESSEKHAESAEKPGESVVDNPAKSSEKHAESAEDKHAKLFEKPAESAEDKPAKSAEDKPAELFEKPAESADDKLAESSDKTAESAEPA